MKIREIIQFLLHRLFSTVIPTLASSLPNHSPLSALNHASKPPPPPPPTSDSRGRRRFTLTAAAGSNLPLCEIHHRGLLVRVSRSQSLQNKQTDFRQASIQALFHQIQIYCKNDQVCICPDCESEDHYDHDTVTIKQEWMEKKVGNLLTVTPFKTKRNPISSCQQCVWFVRSSYVCRSR